MTRQRFFLAPLIALFAFFLVGCQTANSPETPSTTPTGSPETASPPLQNEWQLLSFGAPW